MGAAWTVEMLGADPVPWILASGEPFAAWPTLTGVLGLDAGHPEVAEARTAVLADPRMDALVADLPAWGSTDVPGHHSPMFLPNRLNLLADMGVQWGDRPRVDALLDEMLAHQDRDGRFLTRGKYPGRPKPEWGSLACDTNAITDVLLRFGRSDKRVQRALKRMTDEMAGTPQGEGWRCVPDRQTLFRGPGRKADVCPQVTLEGLRAFSQLPPERRPEQLAAAARTPLEIWRRRAEERPYQFGHGYQFKSVKWPNFWYDVLWVLETVGRFPELWCGPDARDDDRLAIAEMAACLIAYNFAEDGRVTPRRTYRGFEAFSFGQKKQPSPFATARCLVTLARLTDLTGEIRAVDVESLPSSAGGSGKAVPPRHLPFVRPLAPSECPVPRRVPTVTMADAVARVLARHHLGTPWVPSSPESLTADIVALHGDEPLTPYLSLRARLPKFASAELDAALHQRRSLVRFRCMRGSMFVVRPDMLPVVHAVTGAQVIAHARTFASVHGVVPRTYGALAPRILEALAVDPLTVRELRARLSGDGGLPEGADLGAAVSLMVAEGLLVQERPRTGPHAEAAYVRLTTLLPGIRLDSLARPDADVRLVREYVRAFGPVVPRDIVWWTGAGPKRVKRALESLGDEVAEIAIRDAPPPPTRGMAAATFEPALDGTWFVHAADLDEIGSAAPTDSPQVALLPALDPLMMGYGRKGRFVAEEHRGRVFDVGGKVTSVILVDGRVAGVWDTCSHPEPAVLVHLFESVPARPVEPILRAAEETAAFLFGSGAPVKRVEFMPPLAQRPLGAVRKPLRDASSSV